jgi:hypothetical protein
VIGGAGLATALVSLSHFTESTRARRAIEAAAEALQHVKEDKAASEALLLAIKVASIQLSATSLVRVPLHRLLNPFGKLLLISLGVVIVATIVIGSAIALLPDITPISPMLPWATWLAMSVGFYLAYKGALSELRDKFVSTVLAEDGTSLEMISEYNKSLNRTRDGSDSQSGTEMNARVT